jgi:hypothetical protein
MTSFFANPLSDKFPSEVKAARLSAVAPVTLSALGAVIVSA